MKKHTSVFFIFAGLMLAPSVFAEDAKPAAKPAAKQAVNGISVNGVKIPQSRINAMVKERESQGQPDSPELRAMIREELINREVLAQEAIKKGLNKKTDIMNQMELARQAVLVRAYFTDFVQSNPVSDAAMKAEYARISTQMGGKEYKVRHILVEKESDAKSIIEQLNNGAKFDELAAKYSKDPGSKDKGGDLDWSVPGNYVKPFADAITTLGKGKITAAPVKSDFGYHVIQLDDVRDVKLPSLDEVKPGLIQRIQQQMVEKRIGELRSKAKVE